MTFLLQGNRHLARATWSGVLGYRVIVIMLRLMYQRCMAAVPDFPESPEPEPELLVLYVNGSWYSSPE